jgi:plasmid stabilization system protein ParE
MTLRVRPEAVADIVDAARWYETRGVGLGVSFVEEVHAAFERIEAGPLRYAVVHASFRRAFVRRFPFSVYFDLQDADIVVLAVLHQRRAKAVLGRRTTPDDGN